VFWKILEFFIRLVHRKRFKQTEAIGRAAERAGQGDIEEAIAQMDDLAEILHPSLTSTYALTRGRMLNATGRQGEAEQSFIVAAKADPSNAQAHLEMAVMAGRRFKFEEARERLDCLVADADEETQKQAGEILSLLDQVTSGAREQAFRVRAAAMGDRPIGRNGESAGLPADVSILDDWISRCPEDARGQADEIALLLGQGVVVDENARWQVSLSIEDSIVLRPDGTALRPFEVIATRLSSDNLDLKKLIQ
jgi:hypothetical protein